MAGYYFGKRDKRHLFGPLYRSDKAQKKKSKSKRRKKGALKRGR